MKQMRMWILSILILSLFAELVWAKVPVCQEPPSFLQPRNIETLEHTQLPERVFVARSVEVWVDNKDKGLQLLARHNFKTMKSEVKCAKTIDEAPMNVSTWVPALLDLSRDKKWGDALWQIQILSQIKRVGIWSQKTRLAPVEEARKIMTKGTWRMLSLDSYELIWEQNTGGSKMSFRVVFDIMASD